MKEADQVYIEMVNASRLVESQWERLAKLWTRLSKESDPYGATITAEMLRGYYTTESPRVTVTRWVAWEDEDPVGIATYGTFNTKENPHLVELFFGVREDRRHRGIATRILGPVSEKAESDGRSLLIVGTADRAPSGGVVARRLGARHVYTSVARRLNLEDVDRGQLRRWLEEGPRRAGHIRLQFWEGSFPEVDKEDVAYLLNSIENDMPRMDMSMEDMEFTPDQVWGSRQRNIKAGQLYWTYVARDLQTG
ncbi:MAG: GNAT family N-acetyltransferase, partial [Candidatus Geothermarchaeales archaeon]